eukprot:8473136-Karenia_brevis.AAC.1
MELQHKSRLQGMRGMPCPRIAPHSAPGRSGERPEHLEACLATKSDGSRRRFRGALDKLTIGWATGTLPKSARWLMDTAVMFLKKDKELKVEDFDEDEWLHDLQEDGLEDSAQAGA